MWPHRSENEEDHYLSLVMSRSKFKTSSYSLSSCLVNFIIWDYYLSDNGGQTF